MASRSFLEKNPDFLNELLKDEEGTIKDDIVYLKNEHLGGSALNRKAIFDLYSTSEKGKKFIVEFQKTEQKYFKDRSLYYATFPITEQAKKGDWNYKLQAVYMVTILNFVFDADEREPDKYRYDINLCDVDTSRVFYDKLKFIYFTKSTRSLTREDIQETI